MVQYGQTFGCLSAADALTFAANGNIMLEMVLMTLTLLLTRDLMVLS